jgi:DNA-binding response OmpR family regulator
VNDPVLRFGDVEMDRLKRRVRRGGVLVDLTSKEFALLEFLLQRNGECCMRSELLSDVWKMSPESGTNVVDVYINYLRRKLAKAHPEGEASLPVIETVRGEGYRMTSGMTRRKPMSVDALTMEPMTERRRRDGGAGAGPYVAA